MEDFTYFLDTKNLDENVKNTLDKASSDAFEQSDGSIPIDSFKKS
jgi:hypothetical protein